MAMKCPSEKRQRGMEVEEEILGQLWENFKQKSVISAANLF
jgi:hypothetical protein